MLRFLELFAHVADLRRELAEVSVDILDLTLVFFDHAEGLCGEQLASLRCRLGAQSSTTGRSGALCNLLLKIVTFGLLLLLLGLFFGCLNEAAATLQLLSLAVDLLELAHSIICVLTSADRVHEHHVLVLGDGTATILLGCRHAEGLDLSIKEYGRTLHCRIKLRSRLLLISRSRRRHRPVVLVQDGSLHVRAHIIITRY